jgi:hypothetical protein
MGCFLRAGAPVFEIRENSGMTDTPQQRTARGTRVEIG